VKRISSQRQKTPLGRRSFAAKAQSIMAKSVTVGIVRLPHAGGLDLPVRQSSGAAGFDIPAAVVEPVIIKPGGRALIPAGFVLELPPHHEAQVRPRSGLALKHGITVLNSPGTIDADYRGEVMVLLINHGNGEFVVTRGMRIAQLVIAQTCNVALEERDLAAATGRGAGGFGSTGS
jgi:dUTP pyrophosphatase